MDALIQAICDAVCGGILGNAAYDVANPIFLKLFRGKQAPLDNRQALEGWLKRELGDDRGTAEALQRELYLCVETAIKDSFNHVHSLQSAVFSPQSSVFSPQSPIINFLTDYKPVNGDEPVLGRVVELAWLYARLWEDKKQAVINGMGGQGKSTLALYYVDSFAHRYQHIAWISVANGFTTGFAMDKYLHQKLGINLKHTSNEYERFQATLNALQQLPGQNLLVLDNTLHDAADHRYRSQLPKQPNWHLLLTSRHEFSGYAKLELKKLADAPARQLFVRCYGKAVSDIDWTALYELTQGHALSLELFGKTLHEVISRRTPSDLILALQEKRINEAVYNRVISTHHSHGDTTLLEQLLIAFHIPGFTDYQLWLLKQFVALPYRPLDFKIIKVLLQIANSEDDLLNDTLLFLQKSGWLQREEDAFYMHPTIRLAIYYQLYPTDKDVEVLVESVTKFLYFDQAEHNPIEKFLWIPFGEALLNNVKWGNDRAKAELYNNLGVILQNIGNYPKARAYQENSLSINEQASVPNPVYIARSCSNLALVLQDMGDYKGAKVLLERALKLDEQCFGPDHTVTAVTCSNLAMVLKDIGEYSKAKELLENALDIDEQELGPNHASTAMKCSNLAMVLSDLGEYQRAKSLLERALKADEQNFGEDHPNLAVNYSNLGTLLRKLGDYKGAKMFLERALKSDERNFNPNHPSVAARRSNLALVLMDMGDYVEARQHLETALESDESNFGADHPNTAKTCSNLGVVLRKIGEFEEAKKLLERALQSDEQNFGPDHPSTSARCSNLALVLHDMGDRLGAKSLMERALKSSEQNFGSNHPSTATKYHNLAAFHRDQKEWQEAARLFQKAYDIRLKKLGEDHPYTKGTKESLAFVQAQLAPKPSLFQRVKAYFKKIIAIF